jgi:hypothetical protein
MLGVGKALLKAVVRRQHMRRLMLVLSVGFITAMVVVAGGAPTLAQTSEDKAAKKAARQEQKAAKQQQKAAKQQQKAAKQEQPLPKSGGIELNALLLPATVLLVGSGIVAAYGIRHYRRR